MRSVSRYFTERYFTEGEKEIYRVVMKEKLKNKKLNPKTNRIKTFKTNKYLETNIKPEDRTLSNLPRYADRKPKVTFQQWLMIDGKKRNLSYDTTSYGWAANDKCYGFSHRAIHGFYVGEIVKPGTIGNKNEYGKEIDKKYNDMSTKDGYEVADKWRKELGKNFKPYTIKTREEAEQHAIRFAKDVS